MLRPAASTARLAPAVPCPPCTLDCANTRIRPLQRLVRRGWDALEATRDKADRRLPAFVTEEVERALAEVTRWLRREGVRRGGGGAPGTMMVLQRFGAALNLNLHFHVLLLDGLYVTDADGAPPFGCARRWRQADVDALIVRIASRCEGWLARRGFGAEAERRHWPKASTAPGRGRLSRWRPSPLHTPSPLPTGAFTTRGGVEPPPPAARKAATSW